MLLVGNHFSDKDHNQNVWQDLAMHLDNLGYGIITTSHKKNKILRILEMITTILRRRKDYHISQVDVFSGQAFTWAYICVKLFNIIDKPVVLTLHGGNLPEFSRYHSKSVRWLLNHANFVTVPSQYLLEAMRSYRDDLILIPNAVNIHQYSYIKRISPQPKVVWLRAFHKIYHPEMAVEVLYCLHKDFPKMQLTMVGPDKGDGSFQKTQLRTELFNLKEYVELPGGVSKTEVPYWLNKSDIFINTSNMDNTPISVIEAMASGLCIVSTKVGGIPYLLDDGIDALLVQPNDPAAMAAAVKCILTEPGLAEKLSRNARKKAEGFDWSVILPKWEKLFEEINQYG